MEQLIINTTIDGQSYTQKQLEWLIFEREKHVLQEMIHLGAQVTDGGAALSYDDVNYLSAKDAKRILLETKLRLGVEGIRNLYKDEMERSAQMWRDIVKDFHEGDKMVPAVAQIEVKGMTLEQLRQKLALVLSGGDSSVLSEHPEHFGYGTLPGGSAAERVGIETMGMYGGPTEVITMFLPERPAWVPADAGFLPSTCGTSRLLDGTLRQDIAHHQMKPTADGFLLKTTVWFPENTPREMVDGHKLHLAIESCEMIKAAYGAGSKENRSDRADVRP